MTNRKQLYTNQPVQDGRKKTKFTVIADLNVAQKKI